MIAVKNRRNGHITRQNALAGNFLIKSYRILRIGYLYLKGTEEPKINGRIIFGIKIRNGRTCAELYSGKLLKVDIHHPLFIGGRSAVSKALNKILGRILYLTCENRGRRGIVKGIAARLGNNVCYFTVVKGEHTCVFLY